MSYDAKSDQIREQSKGTARFFHELEQNNAAADMKRVRFLAKLDQADLNLTPWEAGFLEDQMDRIKPGEGAQACVFSRKQRSVIDTLHHKYSHRIK